MGVAPRIRSHDRVGRELQALGGGALVLALVAMVCAALFILRSDTESGLGLGGALALLPVPVYLGVVLWADAVEPEPTLPLVLMFLWGAGAAFTLAYSLNTAGTLLVGNLHGPRVAGIYFWSVSAPVVEEVLKAVPLVALLVIWRDRLDDLVDGVVYASMVGLGFATTENVLYYGREALAGGLPKALNLFILRGVWNPFIHPLFTAAVGLAVAWAATRRGRGRWLAPVVGLLVAIVLHSIWNTGVQTNWYRPLYYLLFIPLLALLAITVVGVRVRETRVLADHLPQALGRPARVVAELGTVEGRRALRRVARLRAGRAGRRAAAAYAHAAVELAFLERRIARGEVRADPDGERRRGLRRRFLDCEEELRRLGVLPADRP